MLFSKFNLTQISELLKILFKSSSYTNDSFSYVTPIMCFHLTFSQNFEKLWRYLTKNDQDTRKAFSTLDINRDGYVSKAELVFYLKSLDMVLEKDDEDSTVLNCFYRLDLNSDGKISYPEFVIGWKFYSQKKALYSQLKSFHLYLS